MGQKNLAMGGTGDDVLPSEPESGQDTGPCPAEESTAPFMLDWDQFLTLYAY